ncbi:hypothetical protein CLF_104498 [Clonorchis sinensis]|uniref:Uncharacterized protein n=1 Tax=Clonorchis sinensis TaxID=79923 RepID=G7YNV6_CLOSI|nr:hypothetical protein CLF_104498 [Clonorchis sinensis]
MCFAYQRIARLAEFIFPNPVLKENSRDGESTIRQRSMKARTSEHRLISAAFLDGYSEMRTLFDCPNKRQSLSDAIREEFETWPVILGHINKEWSRIVHAIHDIIDHIKIEQHRQKHWVSGRTMRPPQVTLRRRDNQSYQTAEHSVVKNQVCQEGPKLLIYQLGYQHESRIKCRRLRSYFASYGKPSEKHAHSVHSTHCIWRNHQQQREIP